MFRLRAASIRFSVSQSGSGFRSGEKNTVALTGRGPDERRVGRMHVALEAMRALVPGDIVLFANLIHGWSEDLVLYK